MAYAKLTKALREKIIENAVRGAYQGEDDAIDCRRKAASLTLYRVVVTEEQEKLMKKLPHGFFNLEEGQTRVHFLRDDGGRKASFDADFGNGVRLPANCSGYSRIEVESSETEALFEAIENADNALREKRSSLRTQVSSVVNSASSIPRLIEIWPEGKQFIPEWALVSFQNPNVPAVITSALNSLLAQANPNFKAAQVA